MDSIEVGERQGPKSRVQVLPPDTGRAETTHRARVEMATADGRDSPNHVARRGELKCGTGVKETASKTSSGSCVQIWNSKRRNSRRMVCRRTRHKLRLDWPSAT